MCLAVLEGDNWSQIICVFLEAFEHILHQTPVRNTWKNNCGALCFALISMEIPKLPAYSSHGMCPHPLNFST